MTRFTTLLFVLSLASTLCLSSASYDVQDAREFASLSALSYCDPSDILTWTCGPPCQNLTGYQVYFTQLFNVTVTETLSFTMVYHPSTKRFINAFRGSQGSIELLLEVLEGDAVAYPNISNALVDDYFYNHYMNILRPVFYPELQHAIADFPDYKYIFTGHSLGASLTTLAAFDAISTGILSSDQVMMYNYGMPRLGNIYLTQAIEAVIPEIYRVVHWQDLVPHVPPCLVDLTGKCVSNLLEEETPSGQIAWPAWHLVQQMFYNEDNTDYVACSGAEDPTCSDQFPLTQTSVNDHHYYMGIGLFCHGNSATSIAPLKERDDAQIRVEKREQHHGKRELLTPYGEMDGDVLFGAHKGF